MNYQPNSELSLTRHRILHPCSWSLGKGSVAVPFCPPRGGGHPPLPRDLRLIKGLKSVPASSFTKQGGTS